MKIAATAVGMDAARTYREVEQRSSSISPINGTETTSKVDDFGIRLSRSLSNSSHTQLTSQSQVGAVSGRCLALSRAELGDAAEYASVLSQLTEQVVGQPVTVDQVAEHHLLSSSEGPALLGPDTILPVQSAKLIYSTVYRQEEKVMYSAKGQVQTTDGREISFSLGLSMERTSMLADSISVGLTTYIDPLVLQFDVKESLLSDSVFSFDLNSDSQKEQLACPGKGCGFLAFDRNRDGIINNGSELFGPTTGSGFSELAGFDSDANQWIDENDPIYDKLLIWKQDGQSGESLMSLRQAGVGAISILNAGTSFQLESQDGKILGTVKASGIFLSEDGTVHSLQEIDLAMPSADTTTNHIGWPPFNNNQEVAIQVLRDIISMQQFRLKMRRAEQRLQKATHTVEQRQWLLDWLQNRSALQVMNSGTNEENKQERRSDSVPFSRGMSTHL